jgi:hypothetical protein
MPKPLIENCPKTPTEAQWYCRGVSEALKEVIGASNSWVLSGWLNELIEHTFKLSGVRIPG